MHITITHSDTPIYEQIYHQIVAEILQSHIKEGDCLPSIRELARELSISIITVKKAYERLESEGFIFTRAGLGCFVSKLTQSQGVVINDMIISQLTPLVAYYKSLGLSLQDLQKLLNQIYMEQ